VSIESAGVSGKASVLGSCEVECNNPTLVKISWATGNNLLT